MREIADGDIIHTVLDKASGDEFKFIGKKNREVIVTMSSDAFDTYVEFLQGRSVLARNDDSSDLPGSDVSGQKFNSRITYYLPADGEYILRAGSYDKSQDYVGLGYSILLTEHGPHHIEFGETVKLQVGLNLWSFQLDIGDLVLISVNPFSLWQGEMRVTGGGNSEIVASSRGQIMIFADDSGEEHVLSIDNSREYQFDTRSPYELTVRKVDADAHVLEDGDNRIRLRHDFTEGHPPVPVAMFEVCQYEVGEGEKIKIDYTTPLGPQGIIFVYDGKNFSTKRKWRYPPPGAYRCLVKRVPMQYSYTYLADHDRKVSISFERGER